MPFSPKRPFLPEVEVARGLAILGVLTIHTTARAVRELEPGSLLHSVYVGVNSAANFAVPLFFVLSALVLVYSLGARSRPGWRGFYSRRFRQVVVPYLVWATVYALVRVYRYAGAGQLAAVTPGRVAMWYVDGQAAPHLYFLTVLVQFVVIFPLFYGLWTGLRPANARVAGETGEPRIGVGPRVRTAAPAAGLAVVLAVTIPLQFLYYWVAGLYLVPIYPYTTVLNYVLYLVLGFQLGSNVSGWDAIWRRSGRLFTGAAVAAGLGYVGLSAIWGGQPPDPSAFKLLTYLYVSLAAVVGLFACRTLVGTWLGRVLAVLGKASFGIYAVHILYLWLWEALWRPAIPALYNLAIWGGFAVVLGASYATVVATRKTPLRGLFLGGR